MSTSRLSRLTHRMPLPLAAATVITAIAAIGTQTVSNLNTANAAAIEPATQCIRTPHTAQDYTSAFASLTGDWDGADGAASTLLSDGARLWLFGDTLTGTTDPTTGERRDPGMLHNSILIQRGGCFTNPSPGHDVLPGTSTTYAWPSQAWTTGNTVWISAQTVHATSPTTWTLTGSYLYRFTYSGGALSLQSHQQISRDTSTVWAAAVADPCTPIGQSCDWIYLYATRTVHEPLVFGKELLVARAPRANPADLTAWQYATSATTWSTHRDDAQPIVGAIGGVSTVLSAVPTAHGTTLITKADEYLGHDLITLTSPNPAGPFTRTVIGQAPSTGHVLAYTALAHPDIPSPTGTLIVSVCRNSSTPQQDLTDGRIYRPQFRTVRIDGLTL